MIVGSIKENLSIMVGGITCSHCKESIENALNNFNEIENTSVNQQTGQVVIEGKKLNEEMIKRKIKNLGFFIK